MPVAEDDDLCTCGHMRIGHWSAGSKSDECRVAGCGCESFRDDHTTAITRWRCGHCKTEWDTKERALQCGESRRAPEAAIGDVVYDEKSWKFGWFDGSREWVAREKVSEYGERKASPSRDVPGDYSYSFYYVVVGVERLSPCVSGVRYHLRTYAMSGRNGYRTSEVHGSASQTLLSRWRIAGSVSGGWTDDPIERVGVLEGARKILEELGVEA